MNAPEKLKQYDRDAQVVGNIVHLEHFNVVIDDQRLATLFYVVGLPLSSVTWKPFEKLSVEAGWLPIESFHAAVGYEFAPHFVLARVD